MFSYRQTGIFQETRDGRDAAGVIEETACQLVDARLFALFSFSLSTFFFYTSSGKAVIESCTLILK